MTMRRYVALLAAAVGCAHAKDAEVVSATETAPTIQSSFTADTTRLQPPSAPPSQTEGVRALAELAANHLGAVGQLRPTQTHDGGALELTADLPAPGWGLRARIVPKPELLCQVILDPVALEPSAHAVTAAPWSVHAALAEVRRGLETLKPARAPQMERPRFVRLRAEAEAAAHGGRDPLLSPNEFVRVPRPISDEGTDAPYYVPPTQPSGLQTP